MTTTFIHTADWQLGKAFASVSDLQKRSVLQQERLTVLERVAAAAQRANAEFILVAGDMFDSPHVTKATVASACSAIAAMRTTVLVIPGNHDHGGPGSIWEQSFFRQEAARAPNLRILLKPEPVEMESAILFPCPLLRRQDAGDPTAWLRGLPEPEASNDKPRIVLAHGTVQGFGTPNDDEEGNANASMNFIDLTRLPTNHFDYIALGDWHGTKQVGARAWYSGTPEQDRFARGESNNPGNILKVLAKRAAEPEVSVLQTGRMRWHRLEFDLFDDARLATLETTVQSLLANELGRDLLELNLRGTLGIAEANQLERCKNSWDARLLRLKLCDETVLAPTEEEILELSMQTENPLIARVASALISRCRGTTEEAIIARLALRELHALSNS